MKKAFLLAFVAAGAFVAPAGDDWRETLGKVKDLSGDTGIAGFCRAEAPAYITGNFAEKDRPVAPDFSKSLRHPAD